MHISAVERAGLSTLNEGQQVEYEIVSNRGKESAENLKVSPARLKHPIDGFGADTAPLVAKTQRKTPTRWAGRGKFRGMKIWVGYTQAAIEASEWTERQARQSKA